MLCTGWGPNKEIGNGAVTMARKSLPGVTIDPVRCVGHVRDAPLLLLVQLGDLLFHLFGVLAPLPQIGHLLVLANKILLQDLDLLPELQAIVVVQQVLRKVEVAQVVSDEGPLPERAALARVQDPFEHGVHHVGVPLQQSVQEGLRVARGLVLDGPQELGAPLRKGREVVVVSADLLGKDVAELAEGPNQ